MKEFKDCLVEDLELSVRTAGVLRINEVINMAQFLKLTRPEVTAWKNAGRRTWNEIYDIQDEYKNVSRDDIKQLIEASRMFNYRLSKIRDDIHYDAVSPTMDKNGYITLWRAIG